MSLYALYQDPMQSQPMVIPDTGIGTKMVPEDWMLSDPVMLRHVLCIMIVARHSFHIYLCWRQMRKCDETEELPPQMENVISKEEFLLTKSMEMYAVEQMLLSLIFDSVFSCIELYFSLFPFLWKLIIQAYSIVDDLIWQSIAYVGLVSSYLVMRGLPQVFYNYLILKPFYSVNREKSLPLVGVLCSFCLLIVLLQIILIPLTTVFLFIEKMGGTYFLLWIWGFLLILSIIFLGFCHTYGIPRIGKKTKLPDGELKLALKDVLAAFHFPPDCVYILTDFQKSNPTAYAWGHYCTKHVIILEALLWNQGKKESELFPDEIGKGLHTEEVVAYVAHELTHWYFHDSLKLFGILHVALIIYMFIFSICYRQAVLYEAAGFSPKFYPPIIGYWLVYKYVMPIYWTITNWIIFYLIRRFEHSVDEYVWKLGYSRNFVSAILKLYIDNPVFPVVDPWYLMWHRMKPTTLQRVKHFHRLAASSASRPDLRV